MKIEKITENKIRIIVNQEELLGNNVNINDFILNNSNSQKFFLELLNKAEKEFGFITKDCKLLIETFTSTDGTLVFTITKYSALTINTTTLKLNVKKSIVKNPIYEFSSFEDFCLLCNALNISNISLSGISKKTILYLYNDTYYLVFSNLLLDYNHFKKLFSILSEFSSPIKKTASFEAKLTEYGNIIIKQNALKIGIKYFVL